MQNSHKDNDRSSAAGKQLKQKKANSLAQHHFPALDLFWAKLFRESPAHLPPLDQSRLDSDNGGRSDERLFTIFDRMVGENAWCRGCAGGGGGGGEEGGEEGGRKFNMSKANTEKDCSPRPYTLMCTNQNITITTLFSQFENQSESVSDDSVGLCYTVVKDMIPEQIEYQ